MAARALRLLRPWLSSPKPNARGVKTSYEFVEDVTELPEYEAHKNPPEWKCVESLRFPKMVPRPAPKEEYPSGWRPRRPECAEHPYYVARTRNHMLPLYLKLTHRGARKITKISKIEGDICELGDELKSHLRKKHDRIIAVRVHEAHGIVEVKGDWYFDVQDYLYAKGF